ncbi:hypothetical protein [Tropicimonas sp. IMCC6043]|uniref:hypothetical protein n=1 Tax=Tropicimonas sp. IMCC6043 TaxID=2510645 RepID=UPI0013EDAE59|nr:hypothetical protein [Tropicimonas sp. IMCC6043]
MQAISAPGKCLPLAAWDGLGYRATMAMKFDMDDHARLPWRFHGLTARVTGRG